MGGNILITDSLALILPLTGSVQAVGATTDACAFLHHALLHAVLPVAMVGDDPVRARLANVWPRKTKATDDSTAPLKSNAQQHSQNTYFQVVGSEPSLRTTEPEGGKLPLDMSEVAMLLT